MRGQNLRLLVESEGTPSVVRKLGRALAEGELTVQEFSLRELAEAFLGEAWVRSLHIAEAGGLELLEAGDAVDVTAYSNITGQLAYSAILQGYRMVGFIGESLVRTIPTRLSGEKIPGIGKLTDDAESIGDGMPYPNVGNAPEDYIETPSTTKRGLIVPITKEAIFFDRTGLLIDRCNKVGERLGLNKEKRILDVVLGITNNYKWRGTEYDTYQAATPWINTAGSVELVDWTDVEAAELLFTDMTDPDTGEPILIGGRTLLCMPAKLFTAKRILNATEVEHGDVTDGANVPLTRGANPVGDMGIKLVTSPIAQARLVAASVAAATAKKYWYYGDFPKAFAYMENWPITVVQAPQNSEAEFTQDIVLRFKASERGVCAVWDPRYVLKLTG